MTVVTPWDSAFGLPTPPIATLYNDTVGFWAATIYFCCAVPALLYALLHLRQRKGWMMLLIFTGGALCALVEPFADLLGGCWHPERGQPTVFTVLGRGIPIWVCVGYFTYFGALAAMNYLWFTRGITRRMVWVAFLVPVAVDIFMENLMISHGLYHYYGNQPLDFLGWLPLWWPPINALGEFSGVTALYLLMPHLKGWRMALVPLIFPIADLCSYALIAYPSIIAVNSPTLAPWLTHLIGLSTWAGAFLIIRLYTRLLATDSPLRKAGGLYLPLPTANSLTAARS